MEALRSLRLGDQLGNALRAIPEETGEYGQLWGEQA